MQNFVRSATPYPRQSRRAKEGIKALDHTCRHYLNISGEEFLRLYDCGGLDGLSETGVRRATAMLPFVR